MTIVKLLALALLAIGLSAQTRQNPWTGKLDYVAPAGGTTGQVPTKQANGSVIFADPTSTGGVTSAALQSGKYQYGADAGGDDAYAITLAPVPLSYDTNGTCIDTEICDGTVILMRVATANTGAAALVVNSLASKAIKTPAAADPSDGMIITTALNILVYNRTSDTWQIVGAATSSSGDLTDIVAGTCISVTNPGGPSPTVGVNTAVCPTTAIMQSNTPLVVTLSSSGTSTFVGTMTPTLTAYTTGMIVYVTANSTCSSATLNIDTLGAKTLKEASGTAMTCASGDFLAMWYNGTDFKRIASSTSSAGQTLVTGTSSWAVPAGTSHVRILACSGGGGGNSSTTTDSGGGGGGGACIERSFTPTNLTSIGYVLGAGGAGGIANGGLGQPGGDAVITLNYPVPVSFTLKGATSSATISGGGGSGWGIYSTIGNNGAGAGGTGVAQTSALENNGSGAGGRNNTGTGFPGGIGTCPGGGSGAFTSTTAQTGGAVRLSLFGEAYSTGSGLGGNTTSTTPVAGGAAAGNCAGGGGAGGASGVTGVAGGNGGAAFMRIYYQ